MIVFDTAKHCINQYMVLFCHCSLEGNTVMPGGLHARLCLSSYYSYNSLVTIATTLQHFQVICKQTQSHSSLSVEFGITGHYDFDRFLYADIQDTDLSWHPFQLSNAL